MHSDAKAMYSNISELFSNELSKKHKTPRNPAQKRGHPESPINKKSQWWYNRNQPDRISPPGQSRNT